KLTSAALDPAGLVTVAIAHAFALFVGVSIAANISRGHFFFFLSWAVPVLAGIAAAMNWMSSEVVYSRKMALAVPLGLAIGGNITILTGIFYWIAQLLGSIVASFLLKFVTQLDVPTHTLASGVGAIEGV
ncbi:unnamed protein product, partial [Prunus brigantina]